MDAIEVDGYPAPAAWRNAGWQTIVERAEVYGDSRNPFEVSSDQRWTHVDSASTRTAAWSASACTGRQADPRFLGIGPLDLAALENGGLVPDCSNRFYSSPQNMIFPGLAQVMGDGWETARRRDDANDWVHIRLAGAGRVRVVRSTRRTSSATPRCGKLTGLHAEGEWVELLPRTVLLPDTRHRFLVDDDVRTGAAGYLPGRRAGSAAGVRRVAMNYPRDMVGYGHNPPDPQWPGGAGCGPVRAQLRRGRRGTSSTVTTRRRRSCRK